MGKMWLVGFGVGVGYKMMEVGWILEDWRIICLLELCKNVVLGKLNINFNGEVYLLYGLMGRIGMKLYFDYEGEKILVVRVGVNVGFVYKVYGEYCVLDNILIVEIGEEYKIEFVYYQLIYFNFRFFVFGFGQLFVIGG